MGTGADIDVSQEYINLLARALEILTDYEDSAASLRSLAGFKKCSVAIETELNNSMGKVSALCKGKVDNAYRDAIISEILLPCIDSLIEAIRLDDSQERIIKAYAICKWMDSHIVYNDDNEDDDEDDKKENKDEKANKAKKTKKDKVVLSDLFRVSDYESAVFEALNSNYESTHIWINPKFPIRSSFDFNAEGKKTDRELSNRDAFYGINGELQNCSYFKYDGSVRVTNIVLSDLALRNSEDGTFKIAFAPLTSESLLKEENEEREEPYFDITNREDFFRGGYRRNAFEVELIDNDGKLHKRIIRDWALACQNKAMIVFMPEMLGSENVDGSDLNKCDWMTQLYTDHNNEFGHVPVITIWPSYWHNNQNGSTITDLTGSVVGVQYKNYPFIIMDKCQEEAINQTKKKRYFLIHIQNVHRVSVLICSEFLSDKYTHWSNLLCGCFGVSLLIVPSYSPGELDFLKDAMRYEDYDTTVIWGNCCGASKSSNKCVGIIAKPEVNTMEILGASKECNGACGYDDSCVFMVSLPLEVRVEKKIEVTKVVKHITN